MVFSQSQYPVNEATYVLVKEEKDGKVIGRFSRIKNRFIDRLGSIFLEYSADIKGSRKNFRMYLCDGRHIIDPHDKNVVKAEKGSISRFDKKCNEDYEEKVIAMIDEALKLSEE